MRTPVAAANWKCHTRLESARALASGLREAIDGVQGAGKVGCPPFGYRGAGPQRVAELAEYAIIGHSERRHQFGETDEMVNRKVKAALATGLRPMMCVGETLDEREAGKMEEVLVRQTRSGLEGVDIPDAFIIAYEPVWAIGTGRAAAGGAPGEAGGGNPG